MLKRGRRRGLLSAETITVIEEGKSKLRGKVTTQQARDIIGDVSKDLFDVI